MGQKVIPIPNGETFHGPHTNICLEGSHVTQFKICSEFRFVSPLPGLVKPMGKVTKPVQPRLPHMNQDHSGDRKSMYIYTSPTATRLCWMGCWYKAGGGEVPCFGAAVSGKGHNVIVQD